MHNKINSGNLLFIIIWRHFYLINVSLLKKNNFTRKNIDNEISLCYYILYKRLEKSKTRGGILMRDFQRSYY